MSKNDEKIREVLEQIEKKKKEIGTKPKAAWKSNGILKLKDSHLNINTIGNLSLCVHAAAEVLRERTFYKEASELLGVPMEESNLDDYMADIQLRASMIKYDAENKKLVAMEEKLKALRSEDAKTADAISDILKSL